MLKLQTEETGLRSGRGGRPLSVRRLTLVFDFAGALCDPEASAQNRPLTDYPYLLAVDRDKYAAGVVLFHEFGRVQHRAAGIQLQEVGPHEILHGPLLLFYALNPESYRVVAIGALFRRI